MNAVKFNGKVYSRSSRKDSGPPGEAEILKLNPQREELIKFNTGWKELYAGTLNVKTEHKTLCKVIDKLIPLFEEKPVVYPEKYKSIPIKRNGYRYWKCRLKVGDKRIKCLLRCANVPVKGVAEIVCDQGIRDSLKINDGDEINVRVTGIKKVVDSKTKEIRFFRNHKNEYIHIENMYEGAHAFLICSGPSFNELNKRPLKFCYTMCMNNSAKACMPFFRPNLWTSVDGADKFLYTLWQDPTTLKIVPDSHMKKNLWDNDNLKPVGKKVFECPNVLFFPRNNRFNAETFLSEPTLNWGNNSSFEDENNVNGKRSVMHPAIKILYLLGFKHVYLLGCDFSMSAESKYSFDQDRKKSSIKGNNSSYKQMKWRFNQLRPVFEKADFHIYNCNKNSGLDAFEFIEYGEALKRALGFVDNYKLYVKGKLENTANLYETKWYVCPDCKKDLRVSKEQCVAGIHCECGRQITKECRKKYVKQQDG